MISILWLPIVAGIVLAADLILYVHRERRKAARARSMAAHPAGKGLTPAA